MSEKIKTIVLADDDADDVELFESALKRVCTQYQVIRARDGEQLLLLLETIENPDIIVLDINMPKVTGKECLIKIRANPKTAAIPILVMSTSDFKPDIDFCLANGANNYIPKPGDFKKLKEIAATICEGTWY